MILEIILALIGAWFVLMLLARAPMLALVIIGCIAVVVML